MTSPLNEFTIDAAGKPLGRLSSVVAAHLQGKHLTSYRRDLPPQVTVHVTNAAKVVLTGNKELTAVHHHVSGYPGGLKTERVANILREHPDRVIRTTVARMLPRNRQRALLLKQLIITA